MVIIGSGLGGSAISGGVTAGEIIISVRDQIPDPVYDSSGTPLPDSDGTLLRASTLYRWLNRAVQLAVVKLGWVLDDWTAFAKTQYQSDYMLDAKWIEITDAFADAYPLTRLDEVDTIFPGQPVRQQPLWYGMRSRTQGALTLLFWPVETASDPVTTLSADVGVADVSVPLVSTATFLPFGYVQIEQEILHYQVLTTAPVGVGTLTRGIGGTVPSAHASGSTVTHLSLWCKGKRSPTAITNSTSPIELPMALVHPLELYVLARARRAEQEHQEASSLMQEFHHELDRLMANPSWRVHQGIQVKPYGNAERGGLAFGRVITY